MKYSYIPFSFLFYGVKMQIKGLETEHVKHELTVIDSWYIADDITIKSQYINKKPHEIIQTVWLGLTIGEAKQLAAALIGSIIRVEKIIDEYCKASVSDENNMP